VPPPRPKTLMTPDLNPSSQPPPLSSATPELAKPSYAPTIQALACASVRLSLTEESSLSAASPSFASRSRVWLAECIRSPLLLTPSSAPPPFVASCRAPHQVKKL
jgi:hypothetical protein